ncbi:MAG TPA: MFS transporter [Acidimicrobiales bacterium]|nr:MFS transporter [Acidimicrobiales bacterium]
MTRVRMVANHTFRSLRTRNYRLFLSGQLVSVAGTWMHTVALGWLVLQLTSSGVALGTTVALQFLPLLVFGAWSGSVADRFDKRKILIGTQVAAGVLAIGLWSLVATGNIALWMIYVEAFLHGWVSMLDMPARHSFVTEMVGADDVPNAVSLNSAVFNSGRLIGPAIAGVVIASAGLAPCFLLNGISYFAVVGALVAMRPAELHRGEPVGDETRRVRAGLRYVRQTPELLAVLLMLVVIGTFGFNFIVVVPLLARFVFHAGPELYGALFSAMAAGSLAGALFTAARRGPTGSFLMGSAIAFGLACILSSLAPTVAWEAAALAVVGVTSMLFLATANSTLQLASRPAMRGRVMALYGLVLLGSTPVGAPLMGWIAEQWGARATLAVGGAMSLAAALVALGWSRRVAAKLIPRRDDRLVVAEPAHAA